MNPVLLVILIIGISLVSSAFIKSRSRCPPPKIIYRFIPRNTLDVQFGEDNSPTSNGFVQTSEGGSCCRGRVKANSRLSCMQEDSPSKESPIAP